MIGYMKKHEEYVLKVLSSEKDTEWKQLGRYHKVQFEIIQHERLIHLLVTLFFGLFFVITVLFAAVFEKVVILPLSFLFLVLLIPYIIHYYKLENGVQRWYKIYNQILEKSGEK